MWTTTSKTVSLKVVKNKLAELKKIDPELKSLFGRLLCGEQH